MAKNGQLPASTQPSGAACAAVIQGLEPLTPPYGAGQGMPDSGVLAPDLSRTVEPEPPAISRTFEYLPAEMFRAVSFRQYVWRVGSHMLLWPVQYHMSPKATLEMDTAEGAPAEHPVHTAVTVKLPPAACGGSRAFHDASGELKGLKGGRQPLHSEAFRLRTPQSGPKVCTVALSAACTVVGAPPPAGVSVTCTTASPAAEDAKSRKP